MTFDAQLRSTLQAIHAKPSPVEARAVIDVARLAAAADNKTYLGEALVIPPARATELASTMEQLVRSART